MDTSELAAAIESGIPDADAEVTTPRAPDEEHEDSHFAARVVSPAFAGESIVDRHERVYDAVGDAMTDEIHALEITTYTPEETENRE
jgi:transcriptional regulator, BolA protein family